MVKNLKFWQYCSLKKKPILIFLKPINKKARCAHEQQAHVCDVTDEDIL